MIRSEPLAKAAETFINESASIIAALFPLNKVFITVQFLIIGIYVLFSAAKLSNRLYINYKEHFT